jgi:hypothetical protein
MSAYYTGGDAAAKTGLSEDDLATYRAEGRLAFTHSGGEVLYRADDIDCLADTIRDPLSLHWAVRDLLRRVAELERDAALRSRYAAHPARDALEAKERAARRSAALADRGPWTVEQVMAEAAYALRTSKREALADVAEHGADALEDLRGRLARMKTYLAESRGLDAPDLYGLLDAARAYLAGLKAD